MSKKSKQILKLFLILIFTAIITVLLPKVEKAISYDKIYVSKTETWSIKNLKVGTTKKLSYMFKNKNMFCVELGQELNGGVDFKVTAKYEFDGNTVKYTNSKGVTTSQNQDVITFAKGLSYILAYDCKDQKRDYITDKDTYISENDPKQLALWKYFSDYASNTNVQKVFGKLTNARSKFAGFY